MTENDKIIHCASYNLNIEKIQEDKEGTGRYGNTTYISLYLPIYACIFFFLLSLRVLSAQAFQKTHVRDIAKMSNNWGNAVADYDQDGDLDIFIVAYESFHPSKPESWSRLLQNKGGGWFEDVTVSAGFAQQYSKPMARDHKIGVAWGDYDNDGYPDLFLTHEGKTQLYHNDRDGTFTDVSWSSNISPCDHCVNTSALWWDYDRDGDLDLYISDYQNPNRLFNNRGEGVFSDLTAAAKLGDPGSTWVSLSMDADRDGWLDLYVINDYGYSRFYLNKEGQSFEEATDRFGLRNTGNGMGAAIGDCNNDGYFDVYVTNIAEFQPNALFIGDPSGLFLDLHQLQQVGDADWAWGTHFFDADHDGDEDLYVVNGFGNRFYPNKFFKNKMVEGEFHFTDWSASSFADGQGQGMSMEVFDYDDDGDLDILVSNMNEAPYLYNNIGRATGSNWLQVDLRGTISNRNAFGAILKISAGGKSFFRFHHGAGIMAQSVKPVHFGLGDVQIVDSLTVVWPNSEAETFFHIAANQKIKLIEHANLTTSTEDALKPGAQNPKFKLASVSPNPFSESVSIKLQAGQKGTLCAQIFNLNGRLVWERKEDVSLPGDLEITWSGMDKNGKKEAAGMYLYHIRLNEAFVSGKLILKQ